MCKKYKKVNHINIIKERVDWEFAKKIADEIFEEFRPYCEKIEICGSIRRKSETVKDIEIVCIPKQIQRSDLFDVYEDKVRDPNFINCLNKYPILRSERETGINVQLLHTSGLKIDVFIANADNYGLEVFKRTGPAEVSKEVIGNTMKRRGYYSYESMLYKSGKIIPVKTEMDFFNTIGLQYKRPEERILNDEPLRQRVYVYKRDYYDCV